MNRREREEHPEESFDGGYHLYAEEKHRERVAKNSDRIGCFNFGLELEKFMDMIACVVFIPLSNCLKGR